MDNQALYKVDPIPADPLATPCSVTLASLVTEPNRKQNARRNDCSHSILHTMGVNNVPEQIPLTEILSQRFCEH